MTQDDVLALFRAVAILEPDSASACAEAGLLAFLCSEGYTDVVEAYLHVREGSQVTVER